MTTPLERVVSELERHGITGVVRELPADVPTAAAAAASLGCDVGAIANSLIFNADGDPLLVLTSGAHRVDTARVAELVGATKVRRADPDFVFAATGQRVGGVAPIGHPAPIRTIVDVWLGRYDQVWAAAGLVHTIYPTTLDELVRVTGGTVAEVGD